MSDQFMRTGPDGYEYDAVENYLDDQWDDEPEDDDDPFGDCGMHRDGGIYYCELVGTEDCEFDCPFNIQIGRKRWYTPRANRSEG